MANEDLNQDPNFTTPGGAPLAALARNPHQNVDVVHGVAGGGTPESTVVLQLVDYVPEHTVGGSTQRVDISDRVNSFQFVDLNNPANSDVLWTTPTDTNPFVDNPNEIFSFSGSNFDKPAIQFTLNSPVVVSAFRVVGPRTGPLVSGSYFMNGAGEVSPEGQHSEYIDPTGFTQASSTYTFSINENGLNEPSGVFERLYVYSEETTGATVVPAACTDFVRKIVDGIVTDYAADGVTPYTVQGQILPHCPIQQTNPSESVDVDFVNLFDVVGANPTLTGHITDETMQSFTLGGQAIFHPSTQGVILGATGAGESAQIQIPMTGLVVGSVVTVSPAFYVAPTPDPLRYYVGSTGQEITAPTGQSMQFTATQTSDSLFVVLGENQPEIQMYYIHATSLQYASTECIAFLRKFENGVKVGDYQLDGTTPYTVQGVVQTTCPESNASDCCSISSEYVRSVTSVVPAGFTAFKMPDVQFSTYNADANHIQLVSFSDDNSGFATGVSGNNVWTSAQADLVDFLSSASSLYGQDLTGVLQVSSYSNGGVQTPLLLVKNTSPFNLNNLYFMLRKDDGSNISFATFTEQIAVPDTIEYLLRVVEKDCKTGTIIQKFLNNQGQEVATPVYFEPIVTSLNVVEQELSDIKALVQQLLNNNPTQTQVDTGQPSLRLPSGTYTKAQILVRLNTEHYNAFVDTNAGYFASYGLNSIVFAPSSTFDLSVAGSTSQTYDYPVSLEAGGNEYLLQEVDDFVVVVPTGETLDIHMVVWLTGVAA